MSEPKRIPQHVAIIMDGNGRWAGLHGKERYEGHAAGVEPAEVDALMELFCRSVASETPELKRQGVRIAMIGDRSRFSDKVRRYLAEAERETAEGERLTLILALNYSSRSEITRAVQHLAREAAEGRLQADAITEQTIAGALDTAAYPDPDLIVRTSGEQRLSNFLLWQASYAELWFPEVLWPDFTEADFDRAMEEYARRDRRFGLVK